MEEGSSSLLFLLKTKPILAHFCMLLVQANSYLAIKEMLFFDKLFKLFDVREKAHSTF